MKKEITIVVDFLNATKVSVIKKNQFNITMTYAKLNMVDRLLFYTLPLVVI